MYAGRDIAFLVYVCMHLCMYVCMYVRTYVCMSVRLSVCVYVCMYVCVCSNIFSENSGSIETKFHVEPLWDRGRKFIQMVQVICCSSLLSTSGGRGLLAGILP